MARDTPNTTLLQDIDESKIAYAEAASALDVGDLAELTPAEQLQRHSTAAEEKPAVRVAYEARESGMVARDPANEYDTYDAGNLAKYLTLDGGEELLLNLAAGADAPATALANVTEGDKLTSNGDGKIRKLASGTAPDAETAAIFVAREDNDNSGAAAGEWTKLRVEVLP